MYVRGLDRHFPVDEGIIIWTRSGLVSVSKRNKILSTDEQEHPKKKPKMEVQRRHEVSWIWTVYKVNIRL